METNIRISQTASLVLRTMIIIMAVCAILLAVLTLRWPMENDLPIMLYEGFLIAEHDQMAYRDFFDMNPPATMLMYTLFHWITKGNDFALRLVDFSILGVISFCIAAILRQNGWKSVLLAISSFLLYSLALGSKNALQREMLCVLFVALSFALIWWQRENPRSHWTLFVTGVLAGWTTLIKPPALLFWIPLLMGQYLLRYEGKLLTKRSLAAFISVCVSFGGGLISLFALVTFWLWRQNALTEFVNMVRYYYPLYMELGADAQVIAVTTSTQLARYVFTPLYILWQHPGASILAIVGIFSARTTKDRVYRIQVGILYSMLCVSLSYLAVSGKFWLYQGIPFYFAVTMCLALAVKTRLNWPVWLQFITVIAIITLIPANAIKYEITEWQSDTGYQVNEGTVDNITLWLRDFSDVDATVMPLDGTQGAIHILYRLRRPLHGRFIYEVHFYHHIDNPYIQALRAEMAELMESDPPDIVLAFDSDRPYGPNSSATFPELDVILANDYTVMMTAGNGTVLCRNESIQGDRCVGAP